MVTTLAKERFGALPGSTRCDTAEHASHGAANRFESRSNHDLPHRVSRGALLLVILLSAATPLGDRSALGADSGSYCGVYALFGALRSTGVDVRFEDLLQPKYVSTAAGSTMSDLIEGARDHGAYSVPLAGMSSEVLRTVSCPAILHFRDRYAPTTYNHWVLYAGVEDDRARIVDSNGEIELYPFADLLARWDGAALLVSADPIRLSPINRVEAFSTLAPLLIFAASALVAGMMLKWALRSRGRRFSTRLEACALVTLAVGAALVYHAVAVDGFLQNRQAVREVIVAHNAVDLPEMDLAQFREALADDKCVIIDARFPRSYAAGHIPGAVNVPVDVGPMTRAKLLSSIDKSKPIVVYCQSNGCPFDESIGAGLVIDGFENVSLFTGGWADWSQSQSQIGAK